MNRRNFFKVVTGFVAGVYAACVPTKAKAIEYIKNPVHIWKPKHKYPTLDEIRKNEGDIRFSLSAGHRQKFHTGDRVHISETMPTYMSHFKKGKDATILYSYDDKFRNNDFPSKKPQYALDIDGFGFCAWYDEWLLTELKIKKKENGDFIYRGYLFSTKPFLWDSVLSLCADSDPTHELVLSLPFDSLMDRNINCESRIRCWKEPNIRIATDKQKTAHCQSHRNCVLCDFNSSSTDKCLIDSYNIFV